MSDRSPIEWTDATWNPVRGCAQVSPGCKNCYAERFAERFRGVAEHPFEQGFDLRLVPHALRLPSRWKKARLVFVNSMSDLFHKEVPESYIRTVFEVMASEPRHRFQILTKRSQRLAALAPRLPWPEKTWMGVSVENDDNTFRVHDLRTVPASIRYLSVEPLLGPIEALPLDGIHWVVVGGESGPKCRPMDAAWARSIRRQCATRGVPFFFKQSGGTQKKRAGRLLDGREWNEMPQADVPDACPSRQGVARLRTDRMSRRLAPPLVSFGRSWILTGRGFSRSSATKASGPSRSRGRSRSSNKEILGIGHSSDLQRH